MGTHVISIYALLFLLSACFAAGRRLPGDSPPLEPLAVPRFGLVVAVVDDPLRHESWLANATLPRNWDLTVLYTGDGGEEHKAVLAEFEEKQDKAAAAWDAAEVAREASEVEAWHQALARANLTEEEAVEVLEAARKAEDELATAKEVEEILATAEEAEKDLEASLAEARAEEGEEGVGGGGDGGKAAREVEEAREARKAAEEKAQSAAAEVEKLGLKNPTPARPFSRASPPPPRLPSCPECQAVARWDGARWRILGELFGTSAFYDSEPNPEAQGPGDDELRHDWRGVVTCKGRSYVMALDESIGLSADDLTRLFEVVRDLEVDLAQPSMCSDGDTPWRATRRVPDAVAHFTDFVEIQAPIFSTKLLYTVVAPTFDWSVHSAWGLDLVWPFLMGYPDRKVAVVDSVCATRDAGVARARLERHPFPSRPEDEQAANLERNGYTQAAVAALGHRYGGATSRGFVGDLVEFRAEQARRRHEDAAQASLAAVVQLDAADRGRSQSGDAASAAAAGSPVLAGLAVAAALPRYASEEAAKAAEAAEKQPDARFVDGAVGLGNAFDIAQTVGARIVDALSASEAAIERAALERQAVADVEQRRAAAAEARPGLQAQASAFGSALGQYLRSISKTGARGEVGAASTAEEPSPDVGGTAAADAAADANPAASGKDEGPKLPLEPTAAALAAAKATSLNPTDPPAVIPGSAALEALMAAQKSSSGSMSRAGRISYGIVLAIVACTILAVQLPKSKKGGHAGPSAKPAPKHSQPDSARATAGYARKGSGRVSPI